MANLSRTTDKIDVDSSTISLGKLLELRDKHKRDDSEVVCKVNVVDLVNLFRDTQFAAAYISKYVEEHPFELMGIIFRLESPQ